MDDKKFTYLYAYEMNQDLKELTAKSSILKAAVFKDIFKDRAVDPAQVNAFMVFVNNYLKKWEDYMAGMSKVFDAYDKASDNDNKVNIGFVIRYDFIKDYVYTKYDYAAMLQLTSGLMTGIKEGLINKKADVEDFADHVKDKAFEGLEDDVASMFDTLSTSNPETNLNMKICDAREKSMFKTVASYKKLFSSRDREVLYKAVKSTIEFISNPENTKEYINPYKDLKVMVSVVNNVLDMVTYSLAAYSLRAYAIGIYARPYTSFCHACLQEDAPCSEGVELPGDLVPGVDGSVEISIMRNSDETEWKNKSSVVYMMTRFHDFLVAIGGEKYLIRGPRYTDFISHRVSERWCFTFYGEDFLQKVPMFSKVSDNDLFEMITNHYSWDLYGKASSKAHEINNRIKQITHNRTQGVPNTSSSKQNFLAVIRGLSEDAKTKEDIVKVSANLFEFGVNTLSGLGLILEKAIDFSTDNLNNPGVNVDTLNANQENIRILEELYSEIAFAILQEARDLEAKYNILASSSIETAVNLNLPSRMTDKSTTSNITSAVPDTSRIPIELTDLYTLPAFESLQYWDEAVKEIYGLKDDIYYSEAFSISDIVNQIIAFIQGIIKKANNWFNNKNLQAAMNYVKQNGDVVINMDFTGATMTVLPFKNNGTGENINLAAVTDKLRNGLKSFTEKDVQSPDAVDQFIKNLYPDETVYNWFYGDKPELGAAKFRNWVLYQEQNQVTEAKVQGVTIDANEIKKRVKWWADTCRACDQLHKSIQTISNELVSSQNAIKSKVVQLTGNSSSQPAKVEDPGTSTQQNSNPGTQQNGSQTTQTNTNTQSNTSNTGAGNSEIASNCAKLNNMILEAIKNLYSPLTEMCMFYINTEYRYFREAYSKGKKAQ